MLVFLRHVNDNDIVGFCLGPRAFFVVIVVCCIHSDVSFVLHVRSYNQWRDVLAMETGLNLRGLTVNIVFNQSLKDPEQSSNRCSARIKVLQDSIVDHIPFLNARCKSSMTKSKNGQLSEHPHRCLAEPIANTSSLTTKFLREPVASTSPFKSGQMQTVHSLLWAITKQKKCG